MAPKKAFGQILRIALTGCLTLAIALAQPPRFVRSSIQVARNFNRTPLPLAINSVAAAADNFLWIASDEGLFRFDGAHFHQASKEPASSVAAVTTDGWVWTGSDRGLIAFRSGESRKMFSQSISSVVARGNEVLVNANGIWRGQHRRLVACWCRGQWAAGTRRKGSSLVWVRSGDLHAEFERR